MYLGMHDRDEGHFHFELASAFCDAVRRKIEEVSIQGDGIDCEEDDHPFYRTFCCKGDEVDIVKIESFVQRLTAH